MKRFFHILFACFAVSAAAGSEVTGTGVRIEGLTTGIADDKMQIECTLLASGLDLGSNGRLKLEFAVETDDRRIILPVVVYSGGLRYRYDRREQALSGAFRVEPYKVYRGVGKNDRYELRYALSIDYYTWMEHASITYREYSHDCGGDRPVSGGVLVADLNPAPVHVEPEIWKPDPALYPHLVVFMEPEVEEVKSRASMIELNIGFPVNVTEVRPAFGDNTTELARADEFVRRLETEKLIDLNAVNIRGYASPEGKYAANERLARGRSESFKQYLVSKYPDNPYLRQAHTSWVAEDWDGFGNLVKDSDIPEKRDVLSIVYDKNIAPDTKDLMLQKIVWWSANYKVILKELYPKLRRIELRADYTVQRLTDNQARELLYTNPDMLSLDEIYRVARFYEPGNHQYREVYEIAARQYPDDLIANHNAAAALLQEGSAEAAWPYLEKTKNDPHSLINYGAYYYIGGDLDRALAYFHRAREAGIGQADHILKIATPGQNR